MAMAFPFEPDPAYIAGSALLAGQEIDRALPYLHRAARLEPRNTRYLMSLAQAFYMAGRPKDSLSVLERVMAIDPEHETAPVFIKKVRSGQSPAD